MTHVDFVLHPTRQSSLLGTLRLQSGVSSRDPELRSTLGKGARQRAAQIGLWDAKLDRVDSIYEEVLSEQTNRAVA